ncbi:hypothetical protein DAI22_04g193150 [Oryza sativa Japonica Group]|nr:hypothetical protein DAI22_04g193150 [Oryza sativa Japonica Group]
MCVLPHPVPSRRRRRTGGTHLRAIVLGSFGSPRVLLGPAAAAAGAAAAASPMAGGGSFEPKQPASPSPSRSHPPHTWALDTRRNCAPRPPLRRKAWEGESKGGGGPVAEEERGRGGRACAVACVKEHV